MSRIFLLSITLGFVLLIFSILIYDNGNINDIDIQKLNEYVLENKIEVEKPQNLNFLIDNIFSNGEIIQFLSPMYYIFISVLITAVALISFGVQLFIDKKFFKKFYQRPNYLRAIRRSFFLSFFLALYFYNRLIYLPTKTNILFFVLIVLIEVVFFIGSSRNHEFQENRNELKTESDESV